MAPGNLPMGNTALETENESVRDPGTPFQIKVFTDFYFVVLMQGQEGQWNLTGGGKYEIEDGQYIETYLYTEMAPAGEWLSWNYKLKDGELHMSGPTEISEGLNENFKLNSMEEIRKRAPKHPNGEEVPAAVVGAWHLTNGSYTNADGEVNERSPDNPFQLSVYTPTHFAYVMQNGQGEWKISGAGQHYTMDGKRYEHHIYQTNPTFKGWTAAFDYEGKDNQLIMKGPIQVSNAEGQDITDEFKIRWEEKRSRIE